MKKIVSLAIIFLFLASSIGFVSFSEVSAQSKIRILWFAAYTREGGFTGGITASRLLPNSSILAQYPNFEVTIVTDASNLPSDWYEYDILLIADTGFPENLTEFKGKLLITLDSAIAPFFYWFTGSNQYRVLWDYTSRSPQKWISPYTDIEVVTSGDSVIYKEKIEEISWLKTRFDVAYAVLVENESKITVALFEVNKSNIKFYWLHMGPYDAWHSETPNRQTFLSMELSEIVLKLSAKKKVEYFDYAMMNYIWYMLYNKYTEKFDEMYESVAQYNITNATMPQVREYKSLAEYHYQKGWQYGHPIRGRIQALPHMRRAYINVKKAYVLLDYSLRGLKHWQALEDNDLAALMQQNAENSTLYWIGGPLNGTYNGVSEIEATWSKFFAGTNVIDVGIYNITLAKSEEGMTGIKAIVIVTTQEGKQIPLRYEIYFKGDEIIEEWWTIDLSVLKTISG
ncbi:nuclear transport factor 2-like protein [Thermococcus paralvinellae]|uniref:SnoaL-like domain-containing protein n=1 Tax=Thermococcus paralvinellae TaxID=582419 RepID=W0I9M4_9EURY|nr:hypothetical protein [Thermococcus paralvinellae]AHF81128.1 Hypothetical protein TES1_1753 [Thermococcus paralvinellae]